MKFRRTALLAAAVPAALRFAERTLVMLDGRIAYHGSSDALRTDSAKLERLVGVHGA